MIFNLNSFDKIFITGANGWLGLRFVEILSKRFNPKNIICLIEKNNSCKEISKLNIRIIYGDITSFEDCLNFLDNGQNSLLVHTAGIIHPKIFTSDFFKINFKGTQNLYEACRKKNIKKIIAISSNSAFGSHSKEIFFDEQSSYNPYAKYGYSKYKMEKFLKSKKNILIPNITILRPMWFYGPRQPLRQTLFFKLVREGNFPVLGNGNNLRSMTYIDNLIEAIFLSLDSNLKNADDFWIADEKPYKMIEIIETVKKVLKYEFGFDVKNKNLNVPYIISDLARYADLALQFLGIYNQKIHVLSEMNQTIACKIDKARNLLNYRPKISLYEGMKKSIGWCIENNIKF